MSLHLVGTASQWVERWAPLAPHGEALDLACGTGRHTRLLAALGQHVIAVDRDTDVLAQAAGPNVETLAHDLESPYSTWPFAPGRFSLIVVTNYLHRPLMAPLAASLAPDGLLIYETFARGNEAFGKPSNPDFLLEEGELLRHAAPNGLRVLAFEDGFVDSPKPAMVQRLCAAGPAFSRSQARLERAAPGETRRE